MTEDLFIGQVAAYINNICCHMQEISLLGKEGDTEIMLHKLKKSSTAVFSPVVHMDAKEFVFMIEGELLCQGATIKKMIQKGDYFYIHDIKEKLHITALSDVTLLYVSNRSVYEEISHIVIELNEITHKVMQKDLYTYEHNNRLHSYSMQIAEKLDLNRERSEMLLFAAMFHDIGKLNVPDYILQKPGTLNEEEFGYIRQHPSDGKRIISDTYLKYIGDIIEQHHERLDGSGYPRGLRAEEILMEAKIIAVADSYDAMTTDRPYRKAMAPKRAIQELESLVNVHYEKNVVDAFRDILLEQGII